MVDSSQCLRRPGDHCCVETEEKTAQCSNGCCLRQIFVQGVDLASPVLICVPAGPNRTVLISNGFVGTFTPPLSIVSVFAGLSIRSVSSALVTPKSGRTTMSPSFPAHS